MFQITELIQDGNGRFRIHHECYKGTGVPELGQEYYSTVQSIKKRSGVWLGVPEYDPEYRSTVGVPEYRSIEVPAE